MKITIEITPSSSPLSALASLAPLVASLIARAPSSDTEADIIRDTEAANNARHMGDIARSMNSPVAAAHVLHAIEHFMRERGLVDDAPGYRPAPPAPAPVVQPEEGKGGDNEPPVSGAV